ncbi:hypothetical protein [Halovalidus salilacus]|uniref:hypothetical protein n=1 Tax=Halovalidus salilacus TaxID=3075124 RepID=UPI00387DC506
MVRALLVHGPVDVAFDLAPVDESVTGTVIAGGVGLLRLVVIGGVGSVRFVVGGVGLARLVSVGEVGLIICFEWVNSRPARPIARSRSGTVIGDQQSAEKWAPPYIVG